MNGDGEFEDNDLGAGSLGDEGLLEQEQLEGGDLLEGEIAESPAAEGDSAETREGSASEDDAEQGRNSEEEVIDDEFGTGPIFDHDGRIGADDDFEEVQKLTASYREATNFANAHALWENGQLDVEGCRAAGLPPVLPENVNATQRASIDARVARFARQREAAEEKHAALPKDYVANLAAVRGVAQFQKLMSEVAISAGIKDSAQYGRVSEFLFAKAAARGGAKWLADRGQVVRDVRAFVAKHAPAAKPAAKPTAQARPAAQQRPNALQQPNRPAAAARPSPQQAARTQQALDPKRRSNPVGVGKSGGSASASQQNGKAQGGGIKEGQFTSAERAVFESQGNDIRGYTRAEIKAVMDEHKRFNPTGTR